MGYIGVDLGTTAVKLLLMDETGGVQKIVSREYPLYMENGWSEQEPEDWWRAVKDGVRELIAGLDPSSVRAVGFSGQMHGLVMLDENDAVIRRVILWNDQRTQKQCDTLNQDIGREKLLNNAANVALTGFTAPKLLWVRENEPELFAKIKKIMLPKDYLVYRLSGVFATDYSDASGTLLLDVRNKKWSPFMLDTVGITETQLPALFESYQTIGCVTESVAADLGLSPLTKVVIGGGDQAVGAVGSGTVANSMCSLSLGTSGVVFVASDTFAVDYGSSALHSFCHATGKYHMMGVTLAAAASNQWWMELVLKTDDYSGEQECIRDLGRNHVFFLPYMSGERTPHNDPAAKGAFVGMTLTTTREEMTQAVMEGVAFSLRDTLEIVRGLGTQVNTARIIGGGAKSPLWRQMMAHVLHVEVQSINSEEGPALGAAILAAVGDGAYGSVEEAARTVIRVTEVCEPDPRIAALYDERYGIFTQLYRDLKETYRKM